ncbi:hypothetical protein IKF89_02085 [Candidatus Saccharibacteria bacterium]|nr:hypothetical protein [Candidatus Saccharibacteria bacterium]
METTKTLKTADFSIRLAAKILAAINPGEVIYTKLDPFGMCSDPNGVLVSYVEPSELTYPEGWYFAKGTFRNKHNTTKGLYESMPIHKPGGLLWK